MIYSRSGLDPAEAQQRIKELEAQVLLLTQQLDYLKRQLFGRKSERMDHPELFDPEGKEPSSGDVGAPEDNTQAVVSEQTIREPRKHVVRAQRLPKELPVIEEEQAPPAEVAANPSAWRKTSCEHSDQLEKEPGYFYLRRTVRWRYVPVEEPFRAPIIAPAKPRMIENGFLGASLLSELLTNKYLYHLPFYRQHTLNLNRYGVDISENTMYDAAAKVGSQLGILVARMKEHMLQEGVVRADETFIRCLDRKAPGGSKQGYFWVYRGLTGDVIFDWQTSREHRHLAQWLGDYFEGVLQCDGYPAGENYCVMQDRRGKKVRRAACLAHIRRKFEEAMDECPTLVRFP